MYKRLLLVLAIIMLLASQAFSEEARLLRFPNVCGDRVAFMHAGDIYVAPRAGGHATRLTSDDGLEFFPRFSPDGSKIAFTGQYDGDMSVYVMSVDGSEPKRLSYHPGIQRTSARFGPENVVMGWHPDGKRVLFRSRKEISDWWDGRAYLVGLDGGIPQPLPMKVAGFTSFSPDGHKVAYCPIYRDFRTWKRYKGGMAQDVWIFDLDSLTAEKITDWEGTDNLPMWYQDKIYFNSDRTGTLNLFCYDTKTAQTRQVTQFTDFDVRWPSLGPDGIAFENAGYLYVLDLPTEKLNKLDIDITTDELSMRNEYVSVSGMVHDFDISPDANRAVFSARGDIYTVPKKDGNTRDLTNSSGANDRDPNWSPDGKWLCYTSDESGEDEIYLISSEDKSKTRLTTNGNCRKYRTGWSPDSKKIVFSDKNLALYVVDIGTKAMTEIDKADRNEIRSYSWSPDSRFLAYHKRLDNGISAIYIYSFDDKKVHRVTPGTTNDFAPEFDPDGKYLYFLSERNFNPMLGSYEFEFINTAITDLYLILLSADEKSPFEPESDEVKVGASEQADTSSSETKPKAPVKVTIDFDGIYDRQVAFNLPSGNYDGLNAISGAVFYHSQPFYGLDGKIGEAEGVLHKYDIKEKKDSRFAEGLSGYAFTYDGKKVLARKGPEFHVAETSGEKIDLEKNKLDLSKMEMYLDRRAEYRQMFDEVWRMERDFFYDPNMHGLDWKAVGDKYRALLPYVSHRYDLTYLIGEMIGELSCSHTYVGGGDMPHVKLSQTGLLGVDFAVDTVHNRIRIDRILPGENWDEKLRSPLQDPGVDVRKGDYLLAIDGHELTAGDNPYAFTVNCVDRTITLTVNSKPDLKGAHEVTVKPIASEEALRYYVSVDDAARYVDSLSDGQVGYIHIPDMDSWGLIRFSKMFYHQVRKPGLIIDVRYNGGGFVAELILERLRRTVLAMGASRNFAVGPMPGDAVNGYMITLLNQFSCSDGDYFPYFFRECKLGPLMGVRSWGGVIGIRGYRPLVDGGYYTAPEFGIYGLNGKWVMENIGVEPDIEVDNTPTRLARGYDDQLTRATEYLLNEIKTNPKTLPGRPQPPEPR